MSPKTLKLSVVAFLVGVTIPIAFALTDDPPWIDEEFRECVGEAVDMEMQGKIQAYREYNDAYIRDLEAYRQALASAWDIADEKQRKEAIRAADRQYRDVSRQTKRTLDDKLRELKRIARDAQKECKDRQREHERFVKNLCFSTNDCRRNETCSTERGDCQSACPPDAEVCVQVCAGICERSNTSRSRSSTSRFSSGNTSSRSSTNGDRPWEDYQTNGQVCRSSEQCPAGYFCSTNLGECNSPCQPGQNCAQVCEGKCLLFPINPASNSSRSSRSPGQGGINCEPYQCPDGRDFPSCDENGNPINYFQNPCYT